MEERKITVIESRTQKKSVIMSGAETLGEFKRDLDAAGIDYTDMAFYEGLSKSELKTDASLMPKDVPYKGTVTNELVFMLTTVNKKIKSGMDRKELYKKIKDYGLQRDCIEQYGDNYTRLKSDVLQKLIDNYQKKQFNNIVENTDNTEVTEEVQEKVDNAILNIIEKFLPEMDKTIESLREEDACLYDEICNIEHFVGLVRKYIKQTKTDDSNDDKSSYTEEEIDEMFEDLL